MNNNLHQAKKNSSLSRIFRFGKLQGLGLALALIFSISGSAAAQYPGSGGGTSNYPGGTRPSYGSMGAACQREDQRDLQPHQQAKPVAESRGTRRAAGQEDEGRFRRAYIRSSQEQGPWSMYGNHGRATVVSVQRIGNQGSAERGRSPC